MSNESMKELAELAKLVKRRNTIEQKIAEMIKRPGLIGNVGEYIAERVFGIALEKSSTSKGVDGRFKWGALARYSVNVKMYTKPKVIDISLDTPADFYLALTGPRHQSGVALPWLIRHVFLFNYRELLKDFLAHNRKIRRTMSLRRELWDQAEVFPKKRNRRTVLSKKQREMLSLFG